MDGENKDVNEIPSGESINKTGEASGGQQQGEVSYSTYKKTLTQLKNLQEKHKENESLLMQFQQKEKEVEQKRLEEQGEYKKLLDMERTKLSQYEKERDQYRDKLITAHKLNAFNEKLPSKISKPEYYSFVDTDSIIIDPETGLVDETSIDNAVSSFMQNHHQLLDTKRVPLPSDSPSSKSTLTQEEWEKLPYKERKARLPEIFSKER